ncbi:MAG: hypothetical protein SVT52_00520, partial [Planctomycetota bacterium]|nr:hypothetical protein [Planctomycetota bacterium]
SQEALAVADSKVDFDKAADAALVAQNVLETNKSLYPADEYRQKLKRTKDQSKWVMMRREEWEKARVRQQQDELTKAETERVTKEQAQRSRKLQTLAARARSLTEEHKYEASLKVLQQIIRLDPENRWAAERSELLEQFIILQDEREADITQRTEEQRSLLDVRWSEIPWYELLRYPHDWKEVTARRREFGAGTIAESEADRVVRQRLRVKLQTLDFADIQFKDVVQFLRETSGVSIYVNWRALEAVGVDRATTVNVHLVGVTFEKALRIILNDVGGVTPLKFVVDEGVITVSTDDDLSRRTTTRVYDIRDLIVRVPNFVAPRIDLDQIGEAEADTEGGGGFGGEGLFGEDEEEAEDEENIPTKGEIIDDIIDLVKDTIDPTSWRPEGEIGSIRELHGQLVVTQTAENHQRLIELVGQLREARDLQIAIEARFILVSTGFLNSIGIDLDFFFNIGSRLGSATVVDPFTGATVPTTTGVSGWGTGPPGSNNWTPIAAQQGSSTFTNMVGLESPVQSGIGGQITNQALSIAGTFLEDIQVDFLIQATQAHSSTRSLTAPRLTLFNGQRAYVTVATQRAYIADLEPVISDNETAYDPTLAYVPTGTVLDVEGTISGDLRYVTLTVRPQVATLIRFFTYFIDVTATDPATGEPIQGEGFIQLPEVAIQDLQTTVSVPDGGTLLLGGQKLAGEIEREMGVPLLSKIPVINRAFTNRGMIRDEQTLLILIKPKIIIQREEEERQHPPTL